MAGGLLLMTAPSGCKEDGFVPVDPQLLDRCEEICSDLITLCSPPPETCLGCMKTCLSWDMCDPACVELVAEQPDGGCAGWLYVCVCLDEPVH